MLAIAVLIATVSVMAATQNIPLVEADKITCGDFSVCNSDKSKTQQKCSAKDNGIVGCSLSTS